MPTVKTRKPAAERKAQIVDEAMRLAADLGPDRMTTQKLADAVGITQAAIFRHFPSKSEIWQAVADRIGSAMPARILESDEPPLDRMRAIVRRQFEFIVKTPSIPAILYSRELHAENEALRKQFSAMITRRLELFSGLFQAAIEAGDIRPDLDPDDAARLVLAFIQGMAMRWSMEERSFDLVADGMRLLELQLRP
ncbi:MAG: TetR family transcriptional regulator [Rhodobacteraceae bacterium]|nr:TetR family transcriptional regulator [Paracoccaceae bacterium]